MGKKKFNAKLALKACKEGVWFFDHHFNLKYAHPRLVYNEPTDRWFLEVGNIDRWLYDKDNGYWYQLEFCHYGDIDYDRSGLGAFTGWALTREELDEAPHE